MGEIKSTLDLVMERTRHLSLSEEEKTQQKQTDFKKRLQGLLQQFADGAMDEDGITKRIAQLQNELGFDDVQAVNGAILARITPHGENRAWLALMKIYTPSALPLLEKTLADHKAQQAELLQAGTQRQQQTLLQDHGIEGSAVVPNPEREPHYRQALSDLRRQTQKAIEALAQQSM